MIVQVKGLAGFDKDIFAGAVGLQAEVSKAMVKSVNVIKNSAQEIAPYKTGTLRRSIQTLVSSPFRGEVYQDSAMAPYGIMMEYGTSPHEILPKDKQALFWPGAANPVRRVMHPGTSPRPYMLPAFENNIDKITEYFSEALLNVVLIMSGTV